MSADSLQSVPPARLLAVLVGQPRTYGQEGAAHPMDRPWTTSFFKEPVVPVPGGLAHLSGVYGLNVRVKRP